MASTATPNYGVPPKEMSNQDQGKDASAKTRMKMGPAASHQGGNPTSGGGINRPTKGRA